MNYKQAHDLIEELHYKGHQLKKPAFDNLHSMLSMIPETTPDRADLYDALATLKPYRDLPEAVRARIDHLPWGIAEGFKSG